MRKLFSNKTFDLLVIGGGIVGAGIARDAALRGWSVALIEKGDFGSGASSKSSKLIHGGLRYLENGQFGLVFEALRERAILMRIAPHLVRPLPLILPIYKGDPRPAWKISWGLKSYDWLAGRSNIQPHEMLKPYEVPDHIDEMSLRDMRSAALFWDCQMNDARLCLENILDAQAHGAEVMNYTAVTGFLKKDGIVTGVQAEDVLHKEKFQIHARHIVSAVGPWTDVLRKMINPQAAPVQAPTKGVHIVVPKIVETHGALLTAPQDGRPFFVLPFGADHSLIGTTDTDFAQSPDDVSVEESDIHYLVGAVQKAFRNSGISRTSVVSSFAGVRPLLKSSHALAGARSRSHHIISESGLLSIVGGKYTTYRRMAQELCDRIAREEKTSLPCVTATTPLPGTPEGLFEAYARDEAATIEKTIGVGPEAARRLVSTYGKRARSVLDSLRDDPDLRNPLCHHTAILGAEILHAVRNEQARTISDILFRRSWLGYGACQGTDAVATIQRILKRHMGTEFPLSGGE